MKKLYYLSTCSTCKRILHELGAAIDDFERREIKSEPISIMEVDEMKVRSGSYESLFSRKAMKFRAMGLGDKDLTEDDYRQLIASEYTFLKRPVFILDDKIFIGNSPKVVNSLKIELGGN